MQGTAAFATKDDSEQRSFRAEYLRPFVVLATYGIANQYPSRDTQATEETSTCCAKRSGRERRT